MDYPQIVPRIFSIKKYPLSCVENYVLSYIRNHIIPQLKNVAFRFLIILITMGYPNIIHGLSISIKYINAISTNYPYNIFNKNLSIIMYGNLSIRNHILSCIKSLAFRFLIMHISMGYPNIIHGLSIPVKYINALSTNYP